MSTLLKMNVEVSMRVQITLVISCSLVFLCREMLLRGTFSGLSEVSCDARHSAI